MAVLLICSLAYYIVEGLKVPWQPWTYASQTLEEAFGAARYRGFGQRELSFLMLWQNLTAIFAMAISRCQSKINDAEHDKSNHGEFKGTKVGLHILSL